MRHRLTEYQSATGEPGIAISPVVEQVLRGRHEHIRHGRLIHGPNMP